MLLDYLAPLGFCMTFSCALGYQQSVAPFQLLRHLAPFQFHEQALNVHAFAYCPPHHMGILVVVHHPVEAKFPVKTTTTHNY